MPPPRATTGEPERWKADLARRLRRLALDRQGLLKRAAFGRGRAGTRRAIETLGYVQIDSISVASRAHDHVLQARVPGYRPEMLERLQRNGSVFEYWAHAAAYLPTRDYRFAIPRMHAMRARRERWIRSRDDALMADVLTRIRREGPLQARDFEAPPGKRAAWWDWTPAKRALEQLFMQGDLMVIRSGFQKVYDLPERVLPAWVDTTTPSLEEYANYLVEGHLTAFGFASVRACVYQRSSAGLRQAVAQALEEQSRENGLVPFEVNAPERRIYVDPEGLDGRSPAAPGRVLVLSPFDNVIILRHRALQLFGFDYQLECYLPDGRRRFGYFCLPLLYRDRFIGRADCKAHRKTGRFEVKRLFVEHEQWLGKHTDAAFAALADALRELAAHNGCATITIVDVQPRRWRAALAAAVAASVTPAANGATTVNGKETTQ